MNRTDDELQYVCAWGRWRIGPALNEPMAGCSSALHEHRLRDADARSARPGAVKPHRGRARLRLVADAGAPAGAWHTGPAR